ncbi:MAG: cold-shock protein [Alphaproteobacteria bacterium]|nr:cold-shock protein [Alphaproteobacteria bacterium]
MDGTVKWFNPTKGYGFIQPADGSKDVFVHISAVEQAGLRTLQEGQNLNYELKTERGRTSGDQSQSRVLAASRARRHRAYRALASRVSHIENTAGAD